MHKLWMRLYDKVCLNKYSLKISIVVILVCEVLWIFSNELAYDIKFCDLEKITAEITILKDNYC